MPTSTQRSPSVPWLRHWERTLFWVIAVAISLQLASAYARVLTSVFELERYANGLTDYPYGRRVLMEYVYRAGFRLLGGLHLTTRHAHVSNEFLIAVVVTFLSCLLIVLAARLFLQRLLGKDSLFAWLALLSFHILNYNHLLVHENPAAMPYDLPSAAFFGLAMYAAYVSNRWLYYPIFLLATLNRESTLFLPLVFLLFHLADDVSLPQALRRLPLRIYAEAALQLLLWLAIFLLCERLSGGGNLPPLLAANLRMLVNPLHWPTYASVFGFLWIPFLLFFRSIGNLRLQRIAWLMPLWAIILLRYANPLELRVNAEWTVYVTVCIAMILHTLWRRSGRTASPLLSSI